MRYLPAIALLLIVGGCSVKPANQNPDGEAQLATAERLIDAFYSFDPGPLQATLADAPTSQPQILYYQGWVEGGNYGIIQRQPCEFAPESEVVCAITVRDDLIAALDTGFWVTDSFHMTFDDGRIVRVVTSSNDPPEFEQALDWIQAERPEVMSGPCRGFFAGGPTPQACVRAVVDGFTDFRATVLVK